MLYLGCDPGIKGGFGLIDRQGNVVNTYAMPLSQTRKIDPAITYHFFNNIETISIDRLEDVTFICEKVITIPADTGGVKSLVDRLHKAATKGLAEDAGFIMRDIDAELKKTDGRVGVLTMGTNFGILLGAVAAFGWRTEIVPPRTWQKSMWIGADPKLDSKRKTYQIVSRLWPNETGLITKNGKIKDGICDALAIAEYGRRKFNR